MFVDALDLIKDARAGHFRSVTNRWAIPEVLIAYLNHDAIDGWVYMEGIGGALQPYAVTWISQGIRLDIKINLEAVQATGYSNGSIDCSTSTHDSLSSFRPAHPRTLLKRLGMQKETPQLRAAYDEQLVRALEIMNQGVGARCLMTGTQHRPVKDRYSGPQWLPVDVVDRTVINDTTLSEDARQKVDPASMGVLADMPASVPVDVEGGRLPLLLAIEVFDLSINGPVLAPINSVALHTWDEKLRESIVLPESHRRLIDILTSGDLTSHTSDFVQGKTAGNMILCKGQPGVGKTLTAEVYAETMQRPLYPLDMSVLLASEPNRQVSLREHLELAYGRARRWNAVLLLDEADVLVGKRGDNLERNRLTAEMLRATEYVDTLTFITTNRPEDIDDAILSRCAAIIEYLPPTGSDAEHAWKVLAKARGIAMTPKLIKGLTKDYPRLAPREMRQLCRLVAQVSEYENREVDLALFAECAVFRGLTPAHLREQIDEYRREGKDYESAY